MTPRHLALAAGLLLVALPACSGDDSSDDAGDEPAAEAAPSQTEPSVVPTSAPPTSSTTTSPPTSPPTTTNPMADWCALAVAIEEVDDLGDELSPTDPSAVEEYFALFLPLLGEAVGIAPSEIADAVRTSNEIANEANDALAAVDYDLLALDLSVITARDAENEAATDAIEAFNEEQCGIPRDADEDGSADDELLLDQGSLRDQFVASLVDAGFTDDEAACIFGEIDFASAPSLEDPAVISAIFDTCDISLERLAEIESVVPEAGSGEVGDDPLAGGGDEAFAEVFVAALVEQGFTEDEAICIVDEVGTTGTPSDEEVIAAMSACGITTGRIAELMGG